MHREHELGSIQRVMCKEAPRREWFVWVNGQQQAGGKDPLCVLVWRVHMAKHVCFYLQELLLWQAPPSLVELCPDQLFPESSANIFK